MNVWNGVGRLTRDPETRQTNNGMTICRFTLAIDRPKRKDSNDRESDFISCVAFGKTGEVIARYVSKGNKFGVTGRIQTGKYTDKNNVTHFTTDVVVNDFTFIEPRGNSGQQNSNQQGYNNGQGQRNNDYVDPSQDFDVPF